MLVRLLLRLFFEEEVKFFKIYYLLIVKLIIYVVNLLIE